MKQPPGQAATYANFCATPVTKAAPLCLIATIKDLQLHHSIRALSPWTTTHTSSKVLRTDNNPQGETEMKQLLAERRSQGVPGRCTFPDSNCCRCCRSLRPARPPPSRPPSLLLSSSAGALMRGPVVSVAAHGGGKPRRGRKHGLRKAAKLHAVALEQTLL